MLEKEAAISKLTVAETIIVRPYSYGANRVSSLFFFFLSCFSLLPLSSFLIASLFLLLVHAAFESQHVSTYIRPVDSARRALHFIREKPLPSQQFSRPRQNVAKRNYCVRRTMNPRMCPHHLHKATIKSTNVHAYTYKIRISTKRQRNESIARTYIVVHTVACVSLLCIICPEMRNTRLQDIRIFSSFFNVRFSFLVEIFSE